MKTTDSRDPLDRTIDGLLASRPLQEVLAGLGHLQQDHFGSTHLLSTLDALTFDIES